MPYLLVIVVSQNEEIDVQCLMFDVCHDFREVENLRINT